MVGLLTPLESQKDSYLMCEVITAASDSDIVADKDRPTPGCVGISRCL